MGFFGHFGVVVLGFLIGMVPAFLAWMSWEREAVEAKGHTLSGASAFRYSIATVGFVVSFILCFALTFVPSLSS